jgi:hypothetical protein
MHNPGVTRARRAAPVRHREWDDSTIQTGIGGTGVAGIPAWLARLTSAPTRRDAPGLGPDDAIGQSAYHGGAV